MLRSSFSWKFKISFAVLFSLQLKDPVYLHTMSFTTDIKRKAHSEEWNFFFLESIRSYWEIYRMLWFTYKVIRIERNYTGRQAEFIVNHLAWTLLTTQAQEFWKLRNLLLLPKIRSKTVNNIHHPPKSPAPLIPLNSQKILTLRRHYSIISHL